MIKRVFDVIVAAVGLLLLTPLLLLVSLLIKFDSPGPVFFTQERMGRKFRSFRIYKFRTMVPDAPRLGGKITAGADPRITRTGRYLRWTKVDELPQLFNVLKGDMSVVGPRPEVRQYVELFRSDYEEILQVSPGITDLASMHYRHEAELLGRSENPEDLYVKEILPEKIKLAKEYLHRSSFFFDIVVLLKTFVAIVKGQRNNCSI
jgi:lipopolysaccharide/colanic/teichoic acid biosynthesis glycosyltransferase